MNKTVIAFIGGAVCGAAAATLYLRNYYSEVARIEIESVKNFFKTHSKEEEKDKERPTVAEKKNEMKAEEIKKTVNPYHNAVDMAEREHPTEDTSPIPYVVDPDSPRVVNDLLLRVTELTLYEDGEILTYFGTDQIVEDPYELIGDRSNLKCMGKYEPDMLYILDEKQNILYEINCIHGSYEDYFGGSLYNEEDA